MLAMSAAIKAKVNHYLQKVLKYFSKSKAVVLVKRRKKYTKGRGKTIKQTLANLDRNFKEMSRATGERSWDSKANTNALKKLGVFVPPTAMTARDLLETRVEVPEKFPGIMFVATNMVFPDNSDDKVFPNFFYATKYESSPLHVEPTKDIVYKIGLSVPLSVKATKDKVQKNYWLYFYVAVNSEGEVRTLRWVADDMVTIPHKKKPNNVGGNKTCFTRKTWQHPDILNDEFTVKEIGKEAAHVGIFCACFNFWNNRDKMWTVQTKKNDLRMNFCVDTRDTKHYFKDREYATTLSGNRKKIIHFVEEHTRLTPNGEVVVREHIRGERKFVWNGYQCNVKAPKFNNVIHMQGFDVPSFEVEEDDPLINESMDMDDLARELTPYLDREQENIYGKR
jgi:hypothetical protein